YNPLWPASQLFPRLPNPITHTRPRGIHAPGHSFGIIQTMLLDLANFGLERMGRKNSSVCDGMIMLGALRAQKPKKEKRKNPSGRRPHSLLSLLVFYRPISSSPPMKKSGSYDRRDAGQGSWYRM